MVFVQTGPFSRKHAKHSQSQTKDGPVLLGSDLFECSGDSANAVPHTNKLRTRVTHIWGNRRRQTNRSAMEGPLPGRTALLITVSPVPGKYELYRISAGYISLDLLFPIGEVNEQKNSLFCFIIKLFHMQSCFSLDPIIEIHQFNL